MIYLSYKGSTVTQDNNGYINATEICHINSKKVDDWVKTKKAQNYISYISKDLNIPVSQLVISLRGNSSNFAQGTWIHPELAICLGRWISVEFAVWCDRNIKKYMESESFSPPPPPPREIPSSVDYVNAWEKLKGMPRSKMTELIEYRMASELEIENVNQRFLSGEVEDEQRHLTTVNIRAKQLGYMDKQIGDGKKLGVFVKNHLEPHCKDWQGQYLVWHYIVNDELDEVIHSYFD
jgi:hypothetical protein